MTEREIAVLVSNCQYKPGWTCPVFRDGDRLYIQATFQALDPNTGALSTQRGGKHYLSMHMCRQEIVSAVYGAFERAELHECREWFRFCGDQIFNPHIDPEALRVASRSRVTREGVDYVAPASAPQHERLYLSEELREYAQALYDAPADEVPAMTWEKFENCARVVLRIRDKKR